MSNELVIKVSGDIKDFTSKLEAIQKKTQDLTSGLETMGIRAGAAFAGLSAVIGLTIGEYAKQEQAELRTAAVIKSTGEAAGVSAQAVFNLATSFQQTTTYADETVIAAENMLLTFKNIGANVFPQATAAVLDMATAMGQDLTSTAIQVGKALQDPILGITALRRVGVQFNEAQKDNIKAFVETNNLAGAQNVILKELQSEFGGAAEAAAKGTGQFLQLKNQLGEVAEVIGKELFQSLSGVVGQLKEFFQRIAEDKELLKSIASFIKYATIITGVTSAMAIAVTGAVGLSNVIGFLTAEFAAGAIAGATFWEIALGPIGLLVLGFTAVATAAGLFFKAMEKPESSKSLKEINSQLEDVNKELKETLKSQSLNSETRIVFLNREIAKLEELRRAKIKAGEIDESKGTGLGVLLDKKGKGGPLTAAGLGEEINIPLLSEQATKNQVAQEENQASAIQAKRKELAEKNEKERLKENEQLTKKLIDAGKTELVANEDLYERRRKAAHGNAKLLLLIEDDYIQKRTDIQQKDHKRQRLLDEEELKWKLEQKEKLLGTIGGVASSVAGGASGAKSLLVEGSAAGIGAITGSPALGQSLKPLIEALFGGGDFVRGLVKSFSQAIPDLIASFIDGIPALIEEWGNQGPVIIERLFKKLPEIITKLFKEIPNLIKSQLATFGPELIKQIPDIIFGFIKEIPNMVGSFIEALISGAGAFVEALIDSINPFSGSNSGDSNGGEGSGVGGFFGKIGGGISDAVSSVGDFFGFAEGGQPMLKVPSGFANDKFPAALSSGEFVVNNELTGKMEKFFNDNQNNQVSNSLLNEILKTLKTPMNVSSSVNLNTRTFADIILELNRTNQRTA